VTTRAPVTLNLLSQFDLRANDEPFALRPTDPEQPWLWNAAACAPGDHTRGGSSRGGDCEARQRDTSGSLREQRSPESQSVEDRD
jgi:hypothetical protein